MCKIFTHMYVTFSLAWDGVSGNICVKYEKSVTQWTTVKNDCNTKTKMFK